MGRDLGLNPAQIEWAKRNLKPGVFIGQASDGDWREPFVFHVPPIHLPPVVDEAEVAESMRPLEAVPTRPAEEFAHWEPFPSTNLNSPVEPQANRLSEIEIRFLEAVVKEPGLPSSAYAKATGLSGQRSAEVRSRLVTLGYLREHEVATGRRGRAAIVLEPLETAFDALRGEGGGEP